MKTPDYSNGKIYKIISNNEDENEQCYVGSTTCKYLSQRLAQHHSAYKQWKEGKYKCKKTTAFDLFDKYGFDGCSIILLELVNAQIKDELLSREKHYFLTLNCVNKICPIRNIDEKKLIQIQYYEDNKEHLQEKSRITGKYTKKR